MCLDYIQPDSEAVWYQYCERAASCLTMNLSETKSVEDF